MRISTTLRRVCRRTAAIVVMAERHPDDQREIGRVGPVGGRWRGKKGANERGVVGGGGGRCATTGNELLARAGGRLDTPAQDPAF